jgi:crotonobetaine/carnitine-CoA ligase
MDEALVLPRLIDRLADQAPDRPFIVEPDPGRTTTRAEFRELVYRSAGGFRALGVKHGDRVLLMLPTSLAAIASWVGVARLVAIEVPVNMQYRGEMLQYIINDSAAQVMVVAADCLPQVLQVADRCPGLKTMVVIGGDESPTHPRLAFVAYADFLAAAGDVSDLRYPAPHDVGAIVYTSGTTGPSKGVLMPWAQMYETAMWLGPSSALGPEDVLYLPYPFYHVTVKCPVYLTAIVGGCVVVRDKISTGSYWDDIRTYGVTFTILLGVMLNMLMQAPEREDDADNPLRLVGVVPRTSAIADFEKRFGVRTGTIFNMTETSVPLVDYDGCTCKLESCGRPRPGYEVRLVDAFDRQVPPGEAGELIVRTDEPWTLNAGYWRKPEATAQAWRNGWFHTGDAFRVDGNGDYFFVDRFKDAIRRRGENISSMEVEQLVLLNPGVAEVAAVGVPAELGEEDVKLFVVRHGGDLTGEDLIQDLEGRMPAFMVPRFVEFLDELPKTPTYKIRKVELRERHPGRDTYEHVRGA